MNSHLFNKKGTNYAITSPYGIRTIPELNLYNNYHIGTDYAFPQATELVSPLPGEVLKTITWGDYGGQIFLYLPTIRKTLHYAHISRIDVRKGQHTSAKQVLGLSGGKKNTIGAGTSTGAHLHIGIANGKVTSVNKGKMGDGLWTDIESLDFMDPSSFTVQNETGTFTANTTINVRDYPDTKTGNIVSQYFKGEAVHYQKKTIFNGYVWIIYTSKTNETRYMAVREYRNGIRGELWGTIK